MQGTSLWPLLTGTAEDHYRNSVYCEYHHAMPWHQATKTMVTMVRTDRHKLVATHGLAQGELYALETDPDETYNLWDDAEFTRVKLAGMSPN